MSLLARLFLIVLIAILPAIAVQGYNVVALRAEQKADVHDEARRLLALVEAEQARILDGVRQTLTTASQASALRDASGECQAFLRRVADLNPDWLTISATDRNGRIVCSGAPNAVGLDVSDRPYVQAALSGTPFVVGGYVARRGDSSQVLATAIPYRGSDGDMRGALIGLVDLNWLNAYLLTKPMPANAIVTLADRNGVILGRTPSTGDWIGRSLSPPFLERLRGGRKGFAMLEGLDGVPRVVAYSPVGFGFYDMFVSVGLDERAALAPIDAATRRGAALIGTSLALALLATWFFGRRFVERPVDRLTEAARRWSSGDYDARSGVSGQRSEFGLLGRAFDRMADALKEREERLTAANAVERRMARILGSIADAVVEVDRTGRVTFMNAQARRLLSLKRDCVGERLEDLLPRAAEGVFERECRRAVDRQEPVEFEERYAPTGAWYAVRAFPLADGLAIYFQDVTERRRGEAERLAQNARYAAVFDTAVDPIAVIDGCGVVQSFNHAAERAFEREAAATVGEKLSVLLPAAKDDVAAFLRRFIDRRGASGNETEGLRRDGAAFPLNLAVAEWKVAGKTFFTCIMRDVAAEKRAREDKDELLALVATERARLQAVIEHMPVGVWIVAADGRVVGANPAVARIWGGVRFVGPDRYHEFRARRLGEEHEIAPEDWSAIRAVRDGVATLGEELEIETFDGRRRIILASAVPIRDLRGRVIGAVAVNEDVTERRHAEEALRAAKAAAEQANLSKSRFLAAASHDLRQPTQSATFLLAALQDRLKDHSAGELVTHLEGSLDALCGLLDSLLDISKLDAGVIDPKVESFPLAQAVERLRSQYAPRAQAKGLELRTVGCGAWVRSDAALLERILRNLLENALRYTESGRILVGCRRRGDRLRLEVHDTGIGIPEARLRDVFDEFVRIDGSAGSDREQGLGLGLSIVKRLANLLGHQVSVVSRLGKGSIFRIDLPVAVAVAPPAPADALAPRSRARILIVDDEAIILLSFRAMLEDWGHEVRAATSLAGARQEIDGGFRPDLIVSDYRLHGDASGVDAIRAIQEACGDPHMPAILLTGDTAPERLREAEASGLRLLHKPAQPNVLRTTIESALAGSRLPAS